MEERASERTPDEELMLRYRGGDAGAFDELYGRHKGPVFRYLRRQTGDAAVAEELFQDVWMRIINARAEYEVRAKFTTWLYTIARNRLLDHWRSAGRAVLASFDELVDASALDAVIAFPAAGPPPEHSLERKALAGRLLAALEALPAPQREAFLLQQEGADGRGDCPHHRRRARDRQEPPALRARQAARDTEGSGVSPGKDADDPRDEALARAYRATPRDEPPRALDDRILAAAHRAAGARPAPARPDWTRRWRVPLSVAATVVLSATITLMVYESEQAPPPFAPAGAPAEGAGERAPVKRTAPAPGATAEERRRDDRAVGDALPDAVQRPPEELKRRLELERKSQAAPTPPETPPSPRARERAHAGERRDARTGETARETARPRARAGASRAAGDTRAARGAGGPGQARGGVRACRAGAAARRRVVARGSRVRARHARGLGRGDPPPAACRPRCGSRRAPGRAQATVPRLRSSGRLALSASAH
ncbi:MAG: sigma-70 family RNA polymerase sigma factor [Burkholderiales bacterium]|nr:sigma-70 family RNA polymerase sigma factor [Burkholderiales bacterium]